MIIKKITINNFRSYYGSNTFDFSEGLTLIIGDNGDGKTTFFEALQWLLNTSTENATLDHFSEKRKSELEIGEQDTISVSMEFDHDGDKRIEKSFIAERTGENKYTTRNFSFIGYEDIRSERVSIPGKYLVNRCFDTFIQHYSMFKGESNLNVFDNESSFEQLVDKLSDIHEFDDYVEMTDSFVQKSSRAFTKECSTDKKIESQVRDLRFREETCRNNISNTKKDIQDANKSIELFSTKIETLEKNKETCERYQQIKQILTSREQEVIRFRANINKEDFNINLLDKLWILAPFSRILEEFKKKCQKFSKEKRKLQKEYDKEEGKKELIEEMTSSLANGAAPLPWYLPREETLQEMLDDEVCKVCGTKAPKGSEPYNFMLHKLEEYRKHLDEQKRVAETQGTYSTKGKELFPYQYIDEIHNLSISLGGSREKEISDLTTEINDKISLIERFKEELEKAEIKLQETKDDKARLLIQSDGVSESQLEIDFTDLKGYFESKEHAQLKLTKLLDNLRKYEDELESIKADQEKLRPEGSLAKIYQQMNTLLAKVAKAFEEAKETNLTKFLTNLEDCANDYMNRLNKNDFHGRIRLVRAIGTERTIKIKLMSDNKTEIKNPGGAQQTTMYMSVLFAISDLTCNKREEKYPLIFDAPTSSFGSIKEDIFYNIIDKINKQCIIVTKDLLINGKLNYDKINSLTCSVYRIKKDSNFDQNDLSTIHTLIEKIK